MGTHATLASSGFHNGQQCQLQFGAACWTWFWTSPKRTPWAAWPSTGFGHNGVRRHAHWRWRRYCPNSMDRAVGGGGMATPCSRSLIDACSITAMHQDQTRYGAATLTVGPRAHMPGHRTSFLILNSRVCTEPDTVGKLAPWGSLRQRSTNFIMGSTETEAVGKFAQWGSPRRQSANLITGCTEPEAVDKLAPWGSRGCRQIS